MTGKVRQVSGVVKCTECEYDISFYKLALVFEIPHDVALSKINHFCLKRNIEKKNDELVAINLEVDFYYYLFIVDKFVGMYENKMFSNNQFLL